MPPEKPLTATASVIQNQAPRRPWRSFEEARNFACSLGLQSKKDWNAWSQSGARPADIPATPPYVYAQCGWAGWGDWLGAQRGSGDWRPFAEARAFVHTLGLKDAAEWRAWAKSAARPSDIPYRPRAVYHQKGWTGWLDWLGCTRKRRQHRWQPFDEARALARSLNFANSAAWLAWARSAACPSDIPVFPDSAYEDEGWAGWADWLGHPKGSRHHHWRPFEEARALARSLGLASSDAWKVWVERAACPPDLPACPDSVYQAEGWVSWNDWLGRTGRRKRRKMAAQW
jgi:hypothetical protein